MEFRDKLLSSEMRHVTEMVQLLSCELVILQDFMLEMFGPKYTKFRKGHVLSGGEGIIPLNSPGSGYGSLPEKKNVAGARNLRHRDTDKPSSSKDKTQSNVSRSVTRSEQRQDSLESASEPVASAAVGVDEGEEPVSYADLEQLSVEIGGGDDNQMDMDDFSSSDSDCDKKDMEWTESGNSSSFKTGRGKNSSSIWKEYTRTNLPDGKKQATCRNCNENVSPVAKRLQKHYDRCVLGMYKVETSSTPSKKPKGEVWVHFEREKTADGQIIVTCNYCSKKVSNHVTRMSKHLQQNCKKFPGMNESKS